MESISFHIHESKQNWTKIQLPGFQNPLVHFIIVADIKNTAHIHGRSAQVAGSAKTMLQNFFLIVWRRGKLQGLFSFADFYSLKPANHFPCLISFQGMFPCICRGVNGLFLLLKNLLSLYTGSSAFSHVCPLNHNYFLLLLKNMPRFTA